MHSFRATWLTLLALGWIVGCASAPSRQTGFMEEIEVDTSRRELQLLMYEYANLSAGEIELAANRIQEETDDPDVRRMAVLWKLNAIPVAMKSCFTTDPSVALFSAWTFTLQQQDYFETGAGRDVFGEQQPVALAACERMIDRINEIVALSWPPETVAEITPKVRESAARSPIENQLFVRQNFSPQHAASIATDTQGGMSAVGAMHEQILVLNDRANVLTNVMPRQVQWQSELLLAEADAMVAARLDSVFVDAEPLLAYLTSERRALTTDISAERAAVLEAITVQRLAVIQALAEERVAVLTTLERERRATVEEINALTLTAIERIVAESGQVAERSIDHVSARAVQILAIPLLLVVAFGVAVLLLLRQAIDRIPIPVRER